jgi:hypothetical protein
VTFERGSKISHIEERAFSHCSSHLSICIPSSVDILGDECFSQSEADLLVTFETGSRLRRLGRWVFVAFVDLHSFVRRGRLHIV